MPGSKRSRSKTRSLPRAFRIRNEVAKKYDAYIPKRGTQAHKECKKVYESLKAKRGSKSVKAIVLWNRAVREAGYGVAKAGTKVYNQIQKETAARLGRGRSGSRKASKRSKRSKKSKRSRKAKKSTIESALTTVNNARKASRVTCRKSTPKSSGTCSYRKKSKRSRKASKRSKKSKRSRKASKRSRKAAH